MSYHTKSPDFTWHGYDVDSYGTVQNEVTYSSKTPVRRKLQLKRMSTEYAEIEQQYQHSDGTITAIQWFMGRGKNYVQIRARILNRKMDWSTVTHYIDRSMLESYTINGATQLITDTTDVDQYLTDSPLMYVTLNQYSINGELLDILTQIKILLKELSKLI
ncbi:hypothetical protein F6Y03_30660 [Bacillus megaterium]|nr:hypothetical protein [Priestia megaterium]